jgi:hypothetical protein
LVVAGLATAALIPSTGTALAGTTVTHPTGNPTCADLGYSLSFKIDTGDLESKTYADGDSDVVTNWDGQEITISDLSGDGQTFAWSSTLPVSAALVKAGSDNHNLYTYDPPVTSDNNLTHDSGQQGISHLLFCGDEPEPTPTPTEEPTPTPTEEPTPTPVEPTPTPVEPIATPTGGVEGATGTPDPDTTLPPTDAMGGPSSPSGDGWRMILLALAGALGAALILTPSESRISIRRRR